MPNKKPSDYYSTTDLCLAAYLRTNDFPVADYRRVSVGSFEKIEFFFEKTDKVRTAMETFFKTSCFPYKRFYAELKDLKTLIYRVAP